MFTSTRRSKSIDIKYFLVSTRELKTVSSFKLRASSSSNCLERPSGQDQTDQIMSFGISWCDSWKLRATFVNCPKVTAAGIHILWLRWVKGQPILMRGPQISRGRQYYPERLSDDTRMPTIPRSRAVYVQVRFSKEQDWPQITFGKKI